MTKRCYTCKRELDVFAFGRNRARPDGLQQRCKECRKTEPARPEYLREYRRANAERLTAYSHDRHAANPEIARERARQWRLDNPDRKKAADDRWRDDNRDRVNANNRAWSARNQERRREIVRRYDKAHPERSRMQAARRRARLLALPNEPIDPIEVIERDNQTCYLCGLPVPLNDIHLDHVIPVSRGGPHLIDNVRVTHSFCNRSKGSKTPEEYWQMCPIRRPPEVA